MVNTKKPNKAVPDSREPAVPLASEEPGELMLWAVGLSGQALVFLWKQVKIEESSHEEVSGDPWE